MCVTNENESLFRAVLTYIFFHANKSERSRRRVTFLRTAGHCEQESLANAKVSARQPCGGTPRSINVIYIYIVEKY